MQILTGNLGNLSMSKLMHLTGVMVQPLVSYNNIIISLNYIHNYYDIVQYHR